MRPAGVQRSLSEALAGQMQYTYFPVNLEQFHARIECVDLQEGEFSVDGCACARHYLNHPGLTLGYRLECGGVTVVYATDHEPFGSRLFRTTCRPARWTRCCTRATAPRPVLRRPIW